MRWIMLTIVIVIFAYSVTLKYAPTHIAFTPDARFSTMVEHRPALPVIMYMNKHHPDGVLYQSWLDEYRTWVTCKVIGRRVWKYSWTDYMDTYDGENTGRNLYEWLSEMGVTHFIVAPYGQFELPLEDKWFKGLFRCEAYYQDYTLFKLVRLDDGLEWPMPVNLGDKEQFYSIFPKDDRCLGE